MLIDLNGYTKHSREQIFALRPSPVQINYLGYPGTLGADWYDYALVDRFSAPVALQPFFTERLLPLPHMSFPSNPGRLPGGAPPTRAECGLPTDAFVFACFNNAFKILPDVFAVWMRLLHAAERSVLWLLEAGAESEGNLRREAAAAGIDPARLIFAPRISRWSATLRASRPPISSSIRFPTARIRPPTMRCSPACRWSPAQERRWSAASLAASSMRSVCRSS